MYKATVLNILQLICLTIDEIGFYHPHVIVCSLALGIKFNMCSC